MTRERFTAAEARRIALAAQGLRGERPRRVVRAEDLRRTIRRLGLLQLDYVNVVVPAHYQVLYTRLGPFDRGLFERVVYGGREFTEQWAHEASVVPVETWPLLRYRRSEPRYTPLGFGEFLERHPGYLEAVLEEVRRRGPLSPEDLAVPDGAERKLEQSWFGTVPRATMELHFALGNLAVIGRQPSLARIFELAERSLPAEVFARHVEESEARRELLRRAARNYGIATAADLADYWRMKQADVKPRLAELVEAGELVEAAVEGWSGKAYVDAAATVPRRVEARALLAPFDPVVWYRRRTERLFGFEYRLEIFVPPAKRKYGAYVLPFLLGDRLAARVDLKADRVNGRLRVVGAWLESGAEAGSVAEGLAVELRGMAEWLGLERVVVGRRGDLAERLGLAVGVRVSGSGSVSGQRR